MTTNIRFFLSHGFSVHTRPAAGPGHAFHQFLACRVSSYTCITLMLYKDVHKHYITLKTRLVMWKKVILNA